MSSKEDRAKLFAALDEFPHDPLCVDAVRSLRDAVSASAHKVWLEEETLKAFSNPGQLRDIFNGLKAQVTDALARIEKLEQTVVAYRDHLEESK